MLTIQLHKKQQGDVILKCIRQDGSSTWAKLHQGTVYHDLAHIAIEEKLEFKSGFYGRLASGIAISDYELPADKKPERLRGKNLPKEALIAEHLVNLLCIELLSNTHFDLIYQAQTILEQHKLPFPKKLNNARLNTIRAYLNQLIIQWNEVPLGTYLERKFKIN